MTIRIAVIVSLVVGLGGWCQRGFGGEGGTSLEIVGSKQYWKIGIVVTAESGPSKGIFASTPIPKQWPEQDVREINREISSEVRRVRSRNLNGGVRQMVIEIPRLRAGQTASALFTFEIIKNKIPESFNAQTYTVPVRLSKKLRRYLSPSPYIESQHPEIVSLAKQITVKNESSWNQVEAIYDWIRENVEYKNGSIKGALAALHDGDGDCEELTSLFIALCRASRIPARTVWVPGHCYPEFYLHDPDGQGHWFPCQAAGARAFGTMDEIRPVLQKGDNFRVPGDPQKRSLRYAQIVGSLPGRGFVHPKIEIVHERVDTKAHFKTQ